MANDRVILGENCIYSTDCKRTGLNNNVIVCGGSGSGKTVSISEARLLETKYSSMIATVTKRRLVAKYTPLFQTRGYEVLDLNFINPMESNCTYDPLAYINSYSDITFLARSIVKADPQKKNCTADPYWDEAATSLFSAEIAYVLMSEDNPTFADVLQFNDNLKIWPSNEGIQTSLDDKFDRLELMDPGCFAVSCWRSFRSLPIKTAGCVFGTLNTTIDTIFSPELRDMIGTKKNIDFEQLASEKTVLFVSTSAVNPAIHCFVNIFYAQAFKQLFEYAENRVDGILPIPVHFLCDDFATGSRVLNFAEYISIFREKGISVTLLLQSESQLEQMYGTQESICIINNCDSYVFLGGMDLKTAQNVSLRLNAPLEDILYMPVGQEILFRRGQRPIVTRRYDITKNLLYRKITKDYEAMISQNERS